MSATEALLVSIQRASKEVPWRVTFMGPDKVMRTASVGDGGQTPIGPRLTAVIRQYEEADTYPCEVGLQMLADPLMRAGAFRMIGQQIVNLEVTHRTGNHLRSVGPTPSIYKEKESPAAEAEKVKAKLQSGDQEIGIGEAATGEETGEMEIIRSERKYLAVAQVNEIVDGDTAVFTIVEAHEELDGKKAGDLTLTQGASFSARFLGIDSPEYVENGMTEYKRQENLAVSQRWGVSVGTINLVGKEARTALEGYTPKNSLVVLWFQYDMKTGAISVDAYDRPLVVVYKNDIENAALLLELATRPDAEFMNVNKTLLSLRFSGNKELPLYEDGSKIWKEKPGLGIDTTPWGEDVGHKEPNHPKWGGPQDMPDDGTTSQDDADAVDKVFRVKHEKSASNALEFVKPYDDRLENGEIYTNKTFRLTEAEGALEQSYDYVHKVRLGDVMLSVPPLSINYSRMSTIERIKTLRTKSSMMKAVGAAESVLTMELYFHGYGDINGREREGYDLDGEKAMYYMDGLRPLIAQFKKAPFVPIDNHYVNHTLGIQNVALMNMTVESVEGFPESIRAVLTLVKFEPQAFMISEPSLGSLINYPLFRWYYQQAMQPSYAALKDRTYLEPVEKLTNDFSFSLADEDALIYRDETMKKIQQMETPAEFLEKVKTKGNQAGEKYEDGKRARKVLGQFEFFEDNYSPKADEESKKKDPYANGWGVSATPSAGMNGNGSYSSEFFKEMYEGSRPGYKAPQNSSYVPKEHPMFSSWVTTFSENEDWAAAWAAEEKDADGLFVLAFMSEASASWVKASYRMWVDGKRYNRSDGSRYYAIPSTKQNRKQLDYVVDQIAAGEKEADNYREEYQRLLDVVRATEAEVPMDAYPIPNLIPTGLTMMYENQFSKQQMQLLDSPTLQFLGGQDPYIHLSFEGTEETVEALNGLLLQIEEYNRKYRQGIVSGFLGVQNPMVGLFGVKSALPEAVQINTVKGFPGRYQIEMTLVGFNRSQRRQEQLLGFNAAYPDTKIEDRYITNYSQARDFQVIESKMRTMEAYPDLELPTFEELNKVLPSLNAGFKSYPNRQDQVYVDPDFYINSQQTLRNMLDEALTEAADPKMVMYDNSGNQSVSRVYGEGIMETNKNTLLEGFESLDSATDYVKSTFTWEDFDTDKVSSGKTDSYSGGGEGATVTLSDEMKGYLGVDSVEDKPYQEVPAFEAWKAFSGNGKKDKAAYEKWKKGKKNPTEEAIWYHTMNQVMDIFGDDLLYWTTDDAKVLRKEEATNNHHSSIYADESNYQAFSGMFEFAFGPEELMVEEFREFYEALDGFKKMSKLEKPQVEKNHQRQMNGTPYNARTVIGKLRKGGTWKKTADSAPRVPLHRMANYVKSAMMMHSRWEPFDGGGVPVVSQGWRGGICGYPLDIVDKATAERLLWDWKYNVTETVKLMKKHYDAAKARKDVRYVARAHQWMVWMYGCPGQDKDLLLAEDVKSTEDQIVRPQDLAPGNAYFSTLTQVHQSHFSIRKKGTAPGLYRGGQSPVIPAVFSRYTGVKGDAAKAARGEKEAIIKVLVDEAYYPLELYVVAEGSTVLRRKHEKEKHEQLKEKARKALQGMNETRLIQEYHAHMKSMADHAQDNTTLGSILSGKYWRGQFDQLLNLDKIEWGTMVNGSGDSPIDAVDGYIDLTGAADSVLSNRLEHHADPMKTQQGMYTDMLDYDMQGRMVRAFPTFQMFIVDEGKWMANYRIWDNLYGFNAIESIDVNRSRKIAADTAIITMTNMYSNLNGRRNDVYFGKATRPAFFSETTWSQYVLGKPSESYLEARKELYQAMFLQTGARIHLRLGYGSNVLRLPVVFNGTITEMDTAETVTIVCQGDGLELGNIISGDEDDVNKRFFRVQEPSELIGRLLTSKGSWMKDLINASSNGRFYQENPLGIAHFGSPFEVATGNYVPFNRDYGEAAQNVYSQNGHGTYSQWRNEEGMKVDFKRFLTDHETFTNTKLTNMFQPMDEDNIIVKFYNNSVWDVIQTIAYCSSDYIAAVMPYEMRSTLFFGKPHWDVSYKYDSTYSYDAALGSWTRLYDKEHRKPFMQAHLYTTDFNIISNGIKASEDGVFTNVIANYDGHVTPVVQADNDIRLDKQKTMVVEADIVARMVGVEFWTSEDQALKFAQSALRDSMKDMYKGHLMVLGDPTVKPHDIFYMHDAQMDMNGPALVKSVTHHFSMETGFVTMVEPDAVVVNWDWEMLYQAGMTASTLKSMATNLAGVSGYYMTKRLVLKSKVGKWITEGLTKANQGLTAKMESTLASDTLQQSLKKNSFQNLELRKANNALKKAKTSADLDINYKKIQFELDEELKKVNEAIDNAKGGDVSVRMKKRKENIVQAQKLVKEARSAARAGKAAKLGVKSLNVVRTVFMSNVFSAALMVAFTVATESLFEMWRRKKQNLQAVQVMPLRYRGMNFTAGINGHQGAVYGDKPSSTDELLSSDFFDGKEDKSFWEYGVSLANWMSGHRSNNLEGKDENLPY